MHGCVFASRSSAYGLVRENLRLDRHVKKYNFNDCLISESLLPCGLQPVPGLRRSTYVHVIDYDTYWLLLCTLIKHTQFVYYKTLVFRITIM